MSGRIFSFGEKAPFEIDKLDGFRLGKDEPRLRIRGWDEFHFSGQVEGILRSQDEILWKGVVLSETEINTLFTPYPNPHRELARTIRMRSGSYGKPKRAGFVRLETRDASTFSLVLTDSGEGRIKTLEKIVGGIPDNLNLDFKIHGKNMAFTLYEASIHGNKVRKILEQSQK